MNQNAARHIDLHAHLLTREALARMAAEAPDVAPRYVDDPAAGVTAYVAAGQRVPSVPRGLWDLETRLAAMDAARVNVQVISPPPFAFLYELPAAANAAFARIQNEEIARLARANPDRLVGFAALPMQDPSAAAAELRDAVGRLGLRGAAIGTNVAGRNLDDPEFDQVYAVAAELGVPLFLHPGMVAGRDRLARYYLTNLIGNPLDTTIAVASLICGGVLERFPGLRFVVVHGGGFIPYQFGRLDHGWRVRPELAHLTRAPSSYLPAFSFDIITHAPGPLRHLIQTVGAEHVVLGTDYPFDMGLEAPLETLAAVPDLADAERQAILGGNARRLLGAGGA